MTKPRLVFNCSPSLGILDSWMPVLHALKKRLPNAEIVFMAPRSRSIREIDLGSTLFEIAGEIFDRIVFRTEVGGWRTAETFENAKIIEGIFSSSVIARVLRKAKVIKLAAAVDKAHSFTIQYVRNIEPFDISVLAKPPVVILFDLHEVHKSYNYYLTDIFHSAPRFSLRHGNNLGVFDNSQFYNSGAGESVNTVAFLYSSQEKEFYKTRYRLPDSSLRVSGVPRHDTEWINYLISRTGEDGALPDSKYIFVISRPKNDIYHPRNRKIESIRDIKSAAERYGLLVVIKLHPKEHYDGTYEEVFGRENYNVTWTYSNAHPLIIGKRCDFAVSFFSGVSIDMIRLGIPVIERLDLRRLPSCDHEKALRDECGDPVMVSRYLGLVLGASDTTQFMEHVDAIKSNKQSSVAWLQANYRKYYPVIPGVNDDIACEISSALGDADDSKNSGECLVSPR